MFSILRPLYEEEIFPPIEDMIEQDLREMEEEMKKKNDAQEPVNTKPGTATGYESVNTEPASATGEEEQDSEVIPSDSKKASAKRRGLSDESLKILEDWLYYHRYNPYPSEEEKLILAKLASISMTTLNSWFTNARRRLHTALICPPIKEVIEQDVRKVEDEMKKNVQQSVNTEPRSATGNESVNTELGSATGYESVNTEPQSATGYQSVNTEPGSATGYESVNTESQSATGYESVNTEPGSATGYESVNTELGSATGYESVNTEPQSATGCESVNTEPQSANGYESVNTEPGSATGYESVNTESQSATGYESVNTEPGSATGYESVNTESESVTGYESVNTEHDYAASSMLMRRKLFDKSHDILENWLYKHRYSPYPSAEERVMLAELANIPMSKLSRWFTNARRRYLPDMIRRDGHNPDNFIKRRDNHSKNKADETTSANAASNSPNPPTNAGPSDATSSSEIVNETPWITSSAAGHGIVTQSEEADADGQNEYLQSEVFFFDTPPTEEPTTNPTTE